MWSSRSTADRQKSPARPKPPPPPLGGEKTKRQKPPPKGNRIELTVEIRPLSSVSAKTNIQAIRATIASRSRSARPKLPRNGTMQSRKDKTTAKANEQKNARSIPGSSGKAAAKPRSWDRSEADKWRSHAAVSESKHELVHAIVRSVKTLYQSTSKRHALIRLAIRNRNRSHHTQRQFRRLDSRRRKSQHWIRRRASRSMIRASESGVEVATASSAVTQRLRTPRSRATRYAISTV